MGRQRLSELDAEDREHYQERLDREIAALKTLHHPNIVRVHSFDWWPELESGFPYLVMDYIDGPPLLGLAGARHAVARAGLQPSSKSSPRAIEHMHSLGIYHRDFKSDNVLVRTDGEPVVIDFGIARPQLALNLTRAASVGTVTYYAPEYARYCDSAAFSRGEPFDWKPDDRPARGRLHAVPGPHRASGRSPSTPPRSRARPAVLLAIKNEIPPHPSDVDARACRARSGTSRWRSSRRTAAEAAVRARGRGAAPGRARGRGRGRPRLDRPVRRRRRGCGPGCREPDEAGEVVEAAEKLSEHRAPPADEAELGGGGKASRGTKLRRDRVSTCRREHGSVPSTRARVRRPWSHLRVRRILSRAQ